MKRQMFYATAFSAALAVSAAAQTGTGTGTGQTGAQDTQRNQQVTMTGCLQKATSGTAGTSGTATGAGSSDEFILADATSGAAKSGTAGTSGTAASGAASSAMGSKYKLSGGDKEDLTKYLNSKVEVRGTIDRSSSGMAGSATGTGTGTGATGTRAGQSDDKNLPTLRVTSVRQVAESCAGGN